MAHTLEDGMVDTQFPTCGLTTVAKVWQVNLQILSLSSCQKSQKSLTYSCGEGFVTLFL